MVGKRSLVLVEDGARRKKRMNGNIGKGKENIHTYKKKKVAGRVVVFIGS